MNDDAERKLHLRLAVENDQRDIDKERAKRDIEWPLRELAANIIRVVRGAGKSYEIAGQCVAVIEAFQRYREKVGVWPGSSEIDQALSIRREAENASYDDVWELEYAHGTIVRGALQVAASRLVGQNTQEQRGRSELMDGVNSIERIREEMRNRLAEAERVRRQASKPKPSVRKRKARRPSPRRDKVDPKP
jgi:hypothetical protein